MRKLANKSLPNSFGGLFSDCATHCEAFAACGGNRESSPCGCSWPIDSGKRYKCDECPIICRERKKMGPNRPEADFVSHLNTGSLLSQVVVNQNMDIKLPIFIPTSTHYFKDNSILPLSWVATDIRMLFNSRKKQAAVLNHHFATRDSTRQYLRVGPNCNFIAVLNGKDTFLESFWAMKRSRVFDQLRLSGFSIGTGATFSVTDLTYLGTPTPYAHNAAMLMRHHRVIQEIQVSGMEAIPNIYWVDGDQREMQRWTEWLMKNNGIHIISRDFTSTRNPQTVLRKLHELISLLDKVGRPFHVLIVGTGRRTAPLVLQELANSGYSASIVTSAPIQHALRNVKYRLGIGGQIVDEPSPDRTIPFSDLMLHNMKVFEMGLFKSIAGSKIEPQALPNLLAFNSMF